MRVSVYICAVYNVRRKNIKFSFSAWAYSFFVLFFFCIMHTETKTSTRWLCGRRLHSVQEVRRVKVHRERNRPHCAASRVQSVWFWRRGLEKVSACVLCVRGECGCAEYNQFDSPMPRKGSACACVGVLSVVCMCVCCVHVGVFLCCVCVCVFVLFALLVCFYLLMVCSQIPHTPKDHRGH